MPPGEPNARPTGPITIDQLLALNEEIAALVPRRGPAGPRAAGGRP